MGALRAMDIADSFGLEQGIELHLTSNHYPPVPVEMVPTCIEAIDAVNSEGNWEKEVTLPSGITYRGLPTAPASAIIEQHHLEFWIVESELY
jgi:hypothetical protein